MNQQEELVLKILSSIDVIRGKTKFVKILHLVCKLFEKNQKESPFRFKPDHFGVNVVGLEPLLQNMKNQGILNINKSIFSKRDDLSLVNKSHAFENESILEMSPKIETLVQTLNQYAADEVVAVSYDLFPETTINSEIKPKVNKKITELYSRLSPEFEENFDDKVGMKPVSSDVKPLSPSFNDLDVRLNMMKSLGLNELPMILPNIIDESSGLIAKKTSILKNFNFEELLKDDRRG